MGTQTYDTRGKTRSHVQQERMQRVEQAARMFADARSTQEKRSAMDIYAEIGKELGVHQITALQMVKEGSRKDGAPLAYVRRGVRRLTIDGVRYTPCAEVAKYLNVAINTMHGWTRTGFGPKAHVVHDDKGREVLMYRMEEVKEWRAPMKPKTDHRGRVHYYDAQGKPFLKGPRDRGNGEMKEAVVLPPNPVMAAAIAKASKDLEEQNPAMAAVISKASKDLVGQASGIAQVHPMPEQPKTVTTSTSDIPEMVSAADRKATSERKARRVKVTVKPKKLEHETVFNQRYVDAEGKVRTINDAAKYVGVNESQFLSVFYGNVIGYNYGVRGTIPHSYEADPNRKNVRRLLTFKAKDLEYWKKHVWQGVPHPYAVEHRAPKRRGRFFGLKVKRRRGKITMHGRKRPAVVLPQAQPHVQKIGRPHMAAGVAKNLRGLTTAQIEAKRAEWREQARQYRERKARAEGKVLVERPNAKKEAREAKKRDAAGVVVRTTVTLKHDETTRKHWREAARLKRRRAKERMEANQFQVAHARAERRAERNAVKKEWQAKAKTNSDAVAEMRAEAFGKLVDGVDRRLEALERPQPQPQTWPEQKDDSLMGRLRRFFK